MHNYALDVGMHGKKTVVSDIAQRFIDNANSNELSVFRSYKSPLSNEEELDPKIMLYFMDNKSKEFALKY